MGRRRAAPKYDETELFSVGRPMDGGIRIITGDVDGGADNTRKGRSIWTTKAEAELLKQIFERIKAGKGNILLSTMVDEYINQTEGVRIIDNRRKILDK